VHLDTADTGTVTGGADLDVSIETPGGVPGVLDEVVVLTVLGTVSNSEDGVIEGGTASGGGHNTGGVELVDELVGLNGDSNGTLVEGGMELGGGLSGDIRVVGDTNSSGVGGVGASAVLTSVSVLSLVGELVSLSVLEGPLLPATIATTGLGVTVNKLLLGEGDELSSGNSVSTLHSTGGGERPA